MPRQHVWTERAENGEKREIRATHFGGIWRLQSKRHGDEAWTYHDQPLLDDLRSLKAIIERKYRRRRATADDLASLDRLLSQYDNE
ncbi:MAG: hypothetical protein DMF03_05120 [Verrucomicrobia bacterium]|nr:MAG: hypothetical protein DMF03_05120 [Verrucomicrobiota bacterium]